MSQLFGRGRNPFAKAVLKSEYSVWADKLGVRLRLAVLAALAIAALTPLATQAAVPALKISPLKYQQQIPLGTPKIGFVVVSNPTDTTIQVVSQVQAFRQIDQEGDLQFYNSARVTAGITPDLPEFALGPREAVHMTFAIDPNKLGSGGTYAAVFLQTVPDNTNGGNQISPSVRVGTLLILDVGNGGVEKGKISKLHASFLNLGSGIGGSLQYANTGPAPKAIAFDPRLHLTAGLFGKAQTLPSPLVLPQSVRTIRFTHRGSYLGLVHLSVTDIDHHASGAGVWVLACTGYWRWLLPLLLLLIWLAVRSWRRRGRQLPGTGRRKSGGRILPPK